MDDPTISWGSEPVGSVEKDPRQPAAGPGLQIFSTREHDFGAQAPLLLASRHRREPRWAVWCELRALSCREVLGNE
jgi:hypothetical protein